MYGKELILDLYGCDSKMFTRMHIEKWLENLLDEDMLNMNREELHFWDFAEASEEEIADAPDHLLGTTAVQFITTSNVTIHALDRLGEVMVNIFSCKDFNEKHAADFTASWFCAATYEAQVVSRGKTSKCQNIEGS